MGLVSLQESARRLGLSESSVRIAIRRGRIPVIRLGRRVLVAESTLEDIERVGIPFLTRKAD